jgi:hypothetical protein
MPGGRGARPPNLSALLEAVARLKAIGGRFVRDGAEIFYRNGVSAEQAGLTEYAEEHYRTAAQFGHVDAMRRLSRLLAAAGRQEEADEWRDNTLAAENPPA